MKKKIIIGAAAVVALMVAWVALKPSKKAQISLETAPVTRIDVTNSVTATGTVEPVTVVDVGTQVSGIIDKLYVDYNDEVKAGQLVAEMDKVTLQA
ncbi:MAG: biotin/lipoyl-binding protein, partial [Bacteroidales bacterium]|nr:biotin/lipoyl-binding protein [Bacteroidales bacterium]